MLASSLGWSRACEVAVMRRVNAWQPLFLEGRFLCVG